MTVVEVQRRRDPDAVDQVLKSLPEWFGIDDAIAGYVASVVRRDCFLAVLDGDVVGVALVERHFPESAELALIAVGAGHRGSGVGAALVHAVSETLRAEGCSLLQVHTVGSSFENAAYEQTRAFYRRMGFLPLQEFDRIDWDGPTLVLVMQLVTPPASGSKAAAPGSG
ncbi:GNAT family N-acetyltransferase [Arthrobacter sp. 35W]|uniref:GNAT family N-acetyltransferase n=1 Tax=Arthrobacter sp. 35W TaxID=1132441 RepID=UPI0004102095|nr:GNAT family N-acetyltransferase [Arthrobacter sp. 35W]